jgi:hypothetical protein
MASAAGEADRGAQGERLACLLGAAVAARAFEL